MTGAVVGFVVTGGVLILTEAGARAAGLAFSEGRPVFTVSGAGFFVAILDKLVRAALAAVFGDLLLDFVGCFLATRLIRGRRLTVGVAHGSTSGHCHRAE
jgi:hypothetical protein